MKYLNPVSAVAHLKHLKELIDPSQDQTAIDADILEAEAEVALQKIQNISESFKKSCLERIRACDWTQVPDEPIDAAVKVQWDAYRADLRSMVPPVTEFERDAIMWPVEP